jgi:hypothetical protein
MEEIKWFNSAMFGVLTANNLAIGLALAEICCRTFASSSDKSTWHVQNQSNRAFSTLYHNSLDPCGGNEMVQQCHAWCAGCKQSWYWLGSG